MSKNVGSQFPFSYVTGSVQMNTLCLCYGRAAIGFDQFMPESKGVESSLHRLSTVWRPLLRSYGVCCCSLNVTA